MENELAELNNEEAKQYIGAVLFVSIMTAVGTIGNLHVLFVYIFRMKPSNHRIYIVVLAVLDFITCTIGMPFIIVDLRNPLTFTMVSACKVLRFIIYFTCISAVFILTVMAIDRYKKICIPLGTQISRKLAKFLCLLCLCISLLLSLPAPILYGHRSVNTTNPNITGVMCSTDDKFKDKKYLGYFVVVLLLVVLILSGVLVVMYALICRQIRKHANFKNLKSSKSCSETNSKDTRTSDRDDNFDNTSHSGCKEEHIMNKKAKPTRSSQMLTSTTSLSSFGHNTSGDNVNSNDASRNNKLRHQKDIQNLKSKRRSEFNRANKTTWMLIWLTVLFFVSYYPHLILLIPIFVKRDFVTNLSFAGKMSYNTFIWCAFINNVGNCFIYGFCDIQFRTEVKNIYRKLLRRNR